MDGPYRVRNYIASCLKHEAVHGYTVSSKQNAAFQYAICCRIGFGRRADEEYVLAWLMRSGRTQVQLQTMLTRIREGVAKNFLRFHNSHHASVKGLRATRDGQDLISILAREIEDLSRFFGPQSRLVLDKRTSLAHIKLNCDQIDEAKKELEAVLKATVIFPENFDGLESDDLSREQDLWRSAWQRIHEELLWWHVAERRCKREGSKRRLARPLWISAPAQNHPLADFQRVLFLADRLARTDLSLVYELAKIYIAQRKLKEAEILLVRTRNKLSILPMENKDVTLSITILLGELYMEVNRLVEAKRVFVYLTRYFESYYGQVYSQTIHCQRRLAKVQEKMGNYSCAEDIRNKIFAVARRTEGPSKWATVETMLGLVPVLLQQGKVAEAESKAREIMSICGTRKDFTTSRAYNALAAVYWQQGHRKEAEDSCRRAVEMDRTLGHQHHPGSIANTRNLGVILAEGEQKDQDEAESLYRSILETHLDTINPDMNRALLDTVVSLSKLYQREGRFEEEEQVLLRAIEQVSDLGTIHQLDLIDWKAALVKIYTRKERLQDAERVQAEILDTLHLHLADNHSKVLANSLVLAGIYLDQKRPAACEKFISGKIEVFKCTFGEAHEFTLSAMFRLALCLFAQKRWQAADLAFQQLQYVTDATGRTLISRYHRDAIGGRFSALVCMADWQGAFFLAFSHFSILVKFFWDHLYWSKVRFAMILFSTQWRVEYLCILLFLFPLVLVIVRIFC